MMTEAVRAQIESRIARLDGDLADARAKWSSASVGLGSVLFGADPQQVLGRLSQLDRTTLARWRARGRALADGGAVTFATGARDTFDKWTDLGNVIASEIAGAAESAQFSRIDRIVLDTAKATASEVKADVGAALDFWGKHGKKIIVGAVVLVVAFVALRFVRAARAMSS